MTIAVTGSKGQLGSELCRQLGKQAVGLDLPQFDLTDRYQVIDILRQLCPEAVINTAAYTRVDQAEQEPGVARAVNSRGVAHLVEACRAIGALLVQISTDYVFGGQADRQIPYAEDDPPAPLNVYGKTKLEGEREAAQWPEHLIVRTCGLYGRLGPQSAGNFATTMIRRARQRWQLRVVADQHCTPSYVPHVAAAVIFLLRSGFRGTFHVVNTGATTWYDFARELFARAGFQVRIEPITSDQFGAPAPRPRYSVLNTAKYHSLPGCVPMPSWQEAVAAYVACCGQ